MDIAECDLDIVFPAVIPVESQDVIAVFRWIGQPHCSRRLS